MGDKRKLNSATERARRRRTQFYRAGYGKDSNGRPQRDQRQHTVMLFASMVVVLTPTA